jgi:hypothetical protein
MDTAAHLRAARDQCDQRAHAGRTGVSLPISQRMKASEGVAGGTVGALMRLVAVLPATGADPSVRAPSATGRAVRQSRPGSGRRLS